MTNIMRPIINVYFATDSCMHCSKFDVHGEVTVISGHITEGSSVLALGMSLQEALRGKDQCISACQCS